MAHVFGTTLAEVPARPAPARRGGGVIHRLFATPRQGALTVCAGALLLAGAGLAFDWAVLDAVGPLGTAEDCVEATGACWAIVGEKWRLILFGTYPGEALWRAMLACALLVMGAAASAVPRLWSPWLAPAWALLIAVVLVLMAGGVLGLEPVRTSAWGGLPLTLILFSGTVAAGVPSAILLALGRRSDMPVIRAMCVAFIEVVRGVPLIAVLFVASLVIPLFLPGEITIDKLLRAQVGMILFFAAYAAEVVRGGLQALDQGQTDAAEALGLGYWRRMGLVILPQALTHVLPALMNDILRAFKNTTFVSIVGLFDILGATKTAIADPNWIRYAPEAYAFVLALFFVFCTAMSSYSHWLERRLDRDKHSSA
ncbi:amino acid ABC transporter permease [Acuticoccus sp.]|uniref:amino acid ABC transporter permease n=1 Tax=Acuticoccus sp. TaxID=1904378 RepID=UPI003B52768A